MATLDAGICVLRPWREEDVRALAAIANNAKVARNLTHRFPHPYTLMDARFWVSLCQNGDEPYSWAIEANGELAGGMGVHRDEGIFAVTAEVGYWLGEAFWGHGFASAALAAACRYAFSECDFERLESGVFAWNPASMRVLEKNGFKREAWLRNSVLKDGQLIDRALYARLRRE